MREGLRKLLFWSVFVVAPLYALDQWTKRIVHARMGIGEGFTVIPGFFDIIHTRNTGAAFGILRDLPAEYRLPFFAVMTAAACALMIAVFWKSSDSSVFMAAVVSLVVAGALGNLTDRMLFGEVVDFLSFHIGAYRWPTFNLADTWISLGMAGLVIQAFVMQPARRSPPTPPA